MTRATSTSLRSGSTQVAASADLPQLFHRFANATTLAVLVPSRPRPDLIAYLHHNGIHVIYPDQDDWIRLTTETPRTAPTAQKDR